MNKNSLIKKILSAVGAVLGDKLGEPDGKVIVGAGVSTLVGLSVGVAVGASDAQPVHVLQHCCLTDSRLQKILLTSYVKGSDKERF